MRRIASGLLLMVAIVAGMGCHTCDVCDDCGEMPYGCTPADAVGCCDGAVVGTPVTPTTQVATQGTNAVK